MEQDEDIIQFEFIKKGFAYRILLFLYKNKHKGNIYGNIIARNTPIAEANVSYTLKRLEILQLIQKRADSRNKRVKYISITSKGTQLIKLLLQANNILEEQKLKIQKT